MEVAVYNGGGGGGGPIKWRRPGKKVGADLGRSRPWPPPARSAPPLLQSQHRHCCMVPSASTFEEHGAILCTKNGGRGVVT
eukprot:3626234-Rhodomonas_salina.1